MSPPFTARITTIAVSGTPISTLSVVVRIVPIISAFESSPLLTARIACRKKTISYIHIQYSAGAQRF